MNPMKASELMEELKTRLPDAPVYATEGRDLTIITSVRRNEPQSGDKTVLLIGEAFEPERRQNSSSIHKVGALIRRGFPTVGAVKFASTRRKIRFDGEKEIHRCGSDDRMLEGLSTVAALQNPACHLTP
jgi:hypothetical protein